MHIDQKTNDLGAGSPKLSIIVPVYNAERFIARCVDSILGQDFEDFELLLMDDGSRDKSGAILDSYAKKDARVQVIHKENTGVSDTRNQALDLARGEYIQFLDADDWISPEASRLMVRAIEKEKADLVVTDFYRVVGEHVSHKGDIEEEEVMDTKTFAEHMMANPADFYYGVLWNKLYSRQILEEHKLRMDPEVSWCEDFLFNMEYLLHCQRIYALQVPLYYYVKTEGSLVSQGLSLSKIIDMKMSVFRYYSDFFAKLYEPEDYEARRLQMYAFLTDFAKDAGAFSLLPSTKKLGRERPFIDINRQAQDTILTNYYYEQALLDRHLHPLQLHYNLSKTDLRVLLTVAAVNRDTSYRQIANYTGIGRLAAVTSVQKLIQSGYLELESRNSIKGDKNSARGANSPAKGGRLGFFSDPLQALGEFNLSIPQRADGLVQSLVTALEDYKNALMLDFSEEEKRQYLGLSQRVGQNARLSLEGHIEGTVEGDGLIGDR